MAHLRWNLMGRRLWAGAALVLHIALSPGLVGGAAAIDFSRLIEASVEVYTAGGVGSGVILAQGEKGGHAGERVQGVMVLTTAHLIEGEEVVVLRRAARIIRRDEGSDLALLLLDDPDQKGEERGLRVAQREPAVGASLLYIGNALGLLNDTFSRGLLVHKDRPLRGKRFWQMSGIVLVGQSGGAVVDEEGNLVGVLSMTAPAYPGLSFIVPLPVIEEFLKGAGIGESRPCLDS